MNVLIQLGHPAHFHLYKNVAKNLIADGNQVLFVIKSKDILETLLQNAGLPYVNINQHTHRGSKFGVLWDMLTREIKLIRLCRKHKIDLLTGSTPDVAHVGWWLRKWRVNTGEDDAAAVPLFGKIAAPFVQCLTTPIVCDNGIMENKSAKYPSYHELAYLHPNHFTPDPKIVEAYGIDTSKPYFVMRFASLNAHHDSGIKGINTEIAQRLIDILEGSYKENGEENILLEENTENKIENIKDTLTKKDESELTGISSNNLDPKSAQKQAFGQPSAQSCSISLTDSSGKNDIFDIQEKNPKNEMPRIYITSERPLEPQFEKYRIKINPLDMHHVMAFASLYIGDSQTMAAEAGVLGVPFVRFNDFVGRIGYLRELEDTYELGYGIHASVLPADSPIRRNDGSLQPSGVEELYKRVEALVSMPSDQRRKLWSERRKQMLSDKVDCAKFLTWFIENYPQSATEVKNATPDFWDRFK